MSESIISLLIGRRVVRVMEGIILERSVETSPIVGGQGDTFLQSVDQVGIADKVASVKKGIVLSRLDYAPGVLIIPAASREERSGAEDLPKLVEGDIEQAPALEELVLLLTTEDLFKTLVLSVKSQDLSR